MISDVKDLPDDAFLPPPTVSLERRWVNWRSDGSKQYYDFRKPHHASVDPDEWVLEPHPGEDTSDWPYNKAAVSTEFIWEQYRRDHRLGEHRKENVSAATPEERPERPPPRRREPEPDYGRPPPLSNADGRSAGRPAKKKGFRRRR